MVANPVKIKKGLKLGELDAESEAIWLGNFFNVALLVLFPLYITFFQIKPEEKALTELFSDSYIQYCAETRRWI